MSEEIWIEYFHIQDPVMENEYIKLWNLNIEVSKMGNKKGTKFTPIILKSEFNAFKKTKNK